MKKLITSSLLTLAAVPFLMAAPAAKKVQNPAAASQTKTETKTAKKTHKSHVKKNAKGTGTDTAAPSAAQPKQ
jgi:hypothetical protein